MEYHALELQLTEQKRAVERVEKEKEEVRKRVESCVISPQAGIQFAKDCLLAVGEM